MARICLACLVAVVATFGWTGAADAQVEPEFEWTAERPDAIAPAGVTGDRTYDMGQLVFWYRFEGTRLDGLRTGTNPVAVSSVLNAFDVVPLRQTNAVQIAGLSFGFSDWLTLEGSIPFLVNKVQHVTTGDTLVKALTGFQVDTDRYGFGDVRALAHVRLLERGPYRAHITGGVSVPTGSFYQTAVNPATLQKERAPYSLQIGSGTFDGIGGATFTAQNDNTSTGIQAMGLFRPHWNELNYRLGHQLESSVWGAWRVSDWVSLSARIFVHWQGNPAGADAALDATENPAANPFLQGGTRVDLPLGLNIYFPEGALHGQRIAVEYAIPIHQKLDGPQLEQQWQLSVGLRWATGMGNNMPEGPMEEPEG